MLKIGIQYTDRSGMKLGQMNAGDVPGEFWCAKLGDFRVYAADGTCLRLSGEANGGDNSQPAPEKNINI